MINALLLEILKKKITSGEVLIDDVKDDEYKEAINKWINENK